MNEILGVDVDLDWLEGSGEPSELLWTENGWLFADVTVASSVQLYGFVGGLDNQGCSTPKAGQRYRIDWSEFRVQHRRTEVKRLEKRRIPESARA